MRCFLCADRSSYIPDYPEKCIIPKNEQKVFYNLGVTVQNPLCGHSFTK